LRHDWEVVVPDQRKIFVEAPSGGRFAADIPCGTPLNKVAADFFESQGWPTVDGRGRGQRAVVEVVNPHNPGETKRLNGELDACRALEDGDTLRIFPESIAGAVDYRDRLGALVSDQNDMNSLCEWDSTISFTANKEHAPDSYEVTLHLTGFIRLPPGEQQPETGDSHRIQIVLGADYPRLAPQVTWLTPLFHPNVQQPGGGVCLGVLQDRYLPGMGIARLVRMLAEMAQWRNFDAFNSLNQDAKDWATHTDNWPRIRAIGGYPFQGPIALLLREIERENRPRIVFRHAPA
jgi:ubiquitin-protein ligase